MKVLCAECRTEIELKDVPPAVILNNPGVSVVVAQHPVGGFCLGCKSPVALSLEQASLGYLARPVNARPKSPIIVAPASALGRKN